MRIINDSDTILKAWYTAGSLTGRQRKPNGHLDYGDNRTITLCLKRLPEVRQARGVMTLQEHDYGMFLGKQEELGWIVGIIDCNGVPIAIETFDTEEEMKSEWQLD